MGVPVTFTINLTGETLEGLLLDDGLISYWTEFKGIQVVGIENVTIKD